MKNLKVINEKITRQLNNVSFKLKKHSPEILVVAGVIGVVGSAVMACIATTKVSGIMENTKDELDVIHEGVEKGELKGKKYTVEDSKKDLTIVYAQTGLKFVKLYSPAVILGALSITSILASNNILRERNVALAAAYATVDKSFKDYRKRVAERFGGAIERELKLGVKEKEIEETVINEDGKEETVKKTVKVVEDTHDEFTRLFDESNPNWEKDSEHNLYFLRQVQNWANDKLRATGRLFLNEVYDALGFEPTKAGQIVGWIYDAENPTGDNYVDFGIYDSMDARKGAFINGYERNIWLEFNVDGNVWDSM